MDIFSTTFVVINLVYEATIFIRDVTTDIKTYGEAKQDISERLEHELVFVETFQDLCFAEDGGLLKHERVKDSVKRDVSHCVNALNKVLAEYRVEATKYSSPASNEDFRNPVRESLKISDVQGHRKRLKDRMIGRVREWKKKALPLEWSLFGKENMNQLLGTYHEWTERLRQTLSIILLLVGSPGLEFPTSQQASHLRIQEISTRQQRAKEQPPESYGPLTGKMKDSIEAKVDQTLIKGIYEDESGFDPVEVMLEVRQYDEALILAIEERSVDQIRSLKEPLRQLSWLLQSPVDHGSSTEGPEHDYSMHTLSCIGFLDQPRSNRSLLLYRLPPSLSSISDPPSLHSLIIKGTNKPDLGNRFRIARALATTVLSIHTSGWVHKAIRSRNVLLLPGNSLANPGLDPYLIGWDVARLTDSGTSLHSIFELEPNLYHHGQRFGKPSRKFQNEHDIYSLGVVLLEIGLWKTMSTVFAGPIVKKPFIQGTEQVMFYKRVEGVIKEKAVGIEVRKEMGNRFAGIVKTCLEWPTVGENEEGRGDLLMEFRKLVVDDLAVGCKL